MPTVPITINALPGNGKEVDSLVWTDCQNGDGDMDFENDGKTVLFIRNANGATRSLVVTSVADPYGRTGDTTANLAATTGFAVAGPFPPPLFNIGATGRVAVVPSNDAAASDFQVAAVRLPVF